MSTFEETPVTTVRLPVGIETEKSFRLWVRAPLIRIVEFGFFKLSNLTEASRSVSAP